MSARKIKNSWWADFRFNGLRYRKRSPENSRAGAKTYEATCRSKLAKGEPIITLQEAPKETITFKEFSKTWLNVYVKNNNRLSEQQHKEGCLRLYLVPYFGKYPLDQIGNLDIENFKAKIMKTKLSPDSINHFLSALSTCLKTAVDLDIIKNIPRIKRLRVTPNKFDYLTEEEAEQILAQTEGQIKEMIFFCLKTGVRFGELIALDWNDIDFQEKQITIRRSIVRGIMGSTKSNKIRYIPLIGSVSDMLIKRVKSHGFVFMRNKTHFTQHYSCKKLYQACRKAELRKIGWHKLRHTFASHLAQNGVSIQAIKELLGHSSITTTMRYSHLSPSALRAAMSVLEPSGARQIDLGQPVGNFNSGPTDIMTDLVPVNVNIPANTKQKQASLPVSV
ncbi:MAG: tyrosine-type recombinase/integrase [Patescibacteria group bacterium]